MKTKLVKKFTSLSKYFWMGTMLLFLTSCYSQSEKSYQAARKEIEAGHFRLALNLLEKATELEKKNDLRARYFLEAARITRFEVLDFERAIRYYRNVIQISPINETRLEAQSAIAEIYFEDLQNYSAALRELQILEPREKDPIRKQQTILKIAQCYFYLGDHHQSLEQISAFERSESLPVGFLKLKGQIFMAQKKHLDAIAVYNKIYEVDKDYFKKENLFISESLAYEENEKYLEAIDYLRKHEQEFSDKSYLELRLKRLQVKLRNKPLARGNKK